MQLEVKTILNRIQHFKGFVYREVRLRSPKGKLRVEVRIEPHQSVSARDSKCLQLAAGYDRLPERGWLFVPLWGIITWFLFAPRRVNCAQHGVGVEHMPWSQGKRPITRAMMGFLARWARHL
jgi:transposase